MQQSDGRSWYAFLYLQLYRDICTVYLCVYMYINHTNIHVYCLYVISMYILYTRAVGNINVDLLKFVPSTVEQPAKMVLRVYKCLVIKKKVFLS